MAKIIKTDGQEIVVSPKNGTDFSLEELQSIVGGYIEVVYLDDGRLMVVNEEGKLQQLPYNPVATEIVHSLCKFIGDDWIVGDVLVCEREQIK